MSEKALKGIKIVNFGWVYAAPYCAELLSFMGAEVVKVESNLRIDQTRHTGVFVGDGTTGTETSPAFNNINLGAKSVTLNLKNPKGIELAKRLVAESDIVMENMRPGVMKKMGLGYEDLKKVKPDLIMLSMSGFGSEGPYGSYAGYAPVFASFGGAAYLTGYSDGDPNTGSGVMDLRAGTTAAVAVLTALVHRQKTGEGQYIDLSCSESVGVLVGPELFEYSLNGRSPQRCGNRDTVMAPHQVYRCKGDDKWVSIAVATDEEWRALRGVMGEPEWAMDPKYDDVYGRWENQRELNKRMGEWTKDYTSIEIMHMLQDAGVAAMPSFTAEELVNDPHTIAREKFVTVEHPVQGIKYVLTPPWRFSETPACIEGPAPLIGADNDHYFLDVLGLSQEEYASLIEEKAIL
ncbi:MAG: CaiB/BaiF CoA transferase family protein [Oscillospiraceae bacterium]